MTTTGVSVVMVKTVSETLELLVTMARNLQEGLGFEFRSSSRPQFALRIRLRLWGERQTKTSPRSVVRNLELAEMSTCPTNKRFSLASKLLRA